MRARPSSAFGRSRQHDQVIHASGHPQPETDNRTKTSAQPVVQPGSEYARQHHFECHRGNLGHPFDGDRDRRWFLTRVELRGRLGHQAVVAVDHRHGIKVRQSNGPVTKGQPYFVVFFTMSSKVFQCSILRRKDRNLFRWVRNEFRATISNKFRATVSKLVLSYRADLDVVAKLRHFD